MAALVDFPEKQADGNVFSDFAFDAGKFPGGLIDPHQATHLGEDAS
jgi:hypothetical protein